MIFRIDGIRCGIERRSPAAIRAFATPWQTMKSLIDDDIGDLGNQRCHVAHFHLCLEGFRSDLGGEASQQLVEER